MGDKSNPRPANLENHVVLTDCDFDEFQAIADILWRFRDARSFATEQIRWAEYLGTNHSVLRIIDFLLFVQRVFPTPANRTLPLGSNSSVWR
jgi:hypothetical protein